MEEMIKELLLYAQKLGAEYGDIRYTKQRERPLMMRNGEIESAAERLDSGFGCRLIVDGG